MALYWLFEVNKFGKFELFEVNKGCPNVPNISFGFCKALADLIGGGAHKSAALQRQKEPAYECVFSSSYVSCKTGGNVTEYIYSSTVVKYNFEVHVLYWSILNTSTPLLFTSLHFTCTS